MAKIFYCLIIFLSIPWRISAQPALPYKAGVNVQNITPGGPSINTSNCRGCQADYIPVSGSIFTTGGNAAAITDVETPLQTRAIVLEDASGRRVALITLDLLSFTPDFTPDVRSRLVNRGLGIAADDVIINVSHTHNGPTIYDESFITDTNLGKEQVPNAQYVESVKEKIVAAVQQAIQGLQPVSLSVGSAQSNIATYRRSDGKRQRGVRIPQRLDVFHATDANGRSVAVMYFFGCHATSMYNQTGKVSSDFPGASRSYIEGALPNPASSATALFFQGFAGDLEPAGSAKDALGAELGSDVIRTLNSPMKTLNGLFNMRTRTFNLPMEPNAPGWPSQGATQLPVETKELVIGNGASSPDSWTLLFSAYEVVSEFAPNVRSAYAYPSAVTLAGYSNFGHGYLPTQRMIANDANNCGLLPAGGYEGCYGFKLLLMGKPLWHDDDFFANRTLFSDDFNTATTDEERWMAATHLQAGGQSVQDSRVTVIKRDQQLQITPLTGEADLHYNALSTVHTYDLTNQKVSIEIVQIPNPTSGAEFALYLMRDLRNYYAFNVQGGHLRADCNIAGTVTYFPLGAYSSTQHRYVRIRHDVAANTMLWEASADGLAWQALLTRPVGMPITAMRIELVGGTYQFESNPGVIKVDNFRVPDEVTQLVLSDNFNDNSLDANKWNIGADFVFGSTPFYNPSLVVAEQNQQIEIEPLVGISGLNYSGLVAKDASNFVGQQTSVQLVRAPNNTSGAEISLYVKRDNDNYYLFNVQAGQLRADKKIRGITTSIALGAYQPMNHQYLRIANDDASAVMQWQSSADAKTWQTLQSQPVEIDLQTVKVGFIGGTYQAESAPGTIILDNFNVVGNTNAAASLRTQALNANTTTPLSTSSYLPCTVYPNPATSTTTVTYSLPEADYVSLAIYDGTGRLVAHPIDTWQSEGLHTLVYDPSHLPSGIYFCRLNTTRYNSVVKMAVEK